MSTDAPETPALGASQSPDVAWTRIAIRLAFAYFGLRLAAIAFFVDPAIPPDETTHVGRILAFATTWGIPAASPENHALGLLGHRPFLYSWTLARLAALGLDDLLALRAINALLALGTVLYGLRFIRVVSRDPRTHCVFIVLLTNTLMFTGVGASVSYDNAANLCAAAAFYYTASLLCEGRGRDLGALLLCLGLGCLSKRSFLPLAAGIATLVVVHERRRLPDWRRFAAFGRPLWVAVSVVLLANVVLYGGNLLRFGRLVPGFEQVVGTEAALANRIFARDHVLGGYREGRLDLAEALAATARIPHEGDRRSTRAQLGVLQRRLQSGDDWRLDLPRYTYWWTRIMLDRSFGYFGHKVIRRTPADLVAFAAVFLLAIGFSASDRVRASRRPDRQARPPDLTRPIAAVALAYAGVLLFAVNRPTYLETGLLDAGVQGRYLFLVWLPLLGFVAVALCEHAPQRLRTPLAVAACALFLYGDGPTFWLRTTSAWFGG